MAEWSKAFDSSSNLERGVGSNPTSCTRLKPAGIGTEVVMPLDIFCTFFALWLILVPIGAVPATPPRCNPNRLFSRPFHSDIIFLFYYIIDGKTYYTKR